MGNVRLVNIFRDCKPLRPFPGLYMDLEEKLSNFIKKSRTALKGLAYSVVIGVASLGFLAGTVSSATSKYKIERLIMSDPNANFSYASSINNDGEVVGICGEKDGEGHILWQENFLYKNRLMRKLSIINNSQSKNIINDFGDILAGNPDPNWTGKSSAIYKIDGITGLSFWGSDMNNKREVVGDRYVWSNGQRIGICSICYPEGINDKTQVVGGITAPPDGCGYAFIWQDGIRKILGVIGSDVSHIAYDINNKGEIVGWGRYQNASYLSRACIWDEDGGVKILDRANSQAFAINDKGQVVGCIKVGTYPNLNNKAVLYQEGEKIILNDILSEDSEWEDLVSANDINNKGQIIGSGWLKEEGVHAQAFLMTPTYPEGDLNKDAINNFKDLAIIAENWLEDYRYYYPPLPPGP